MPVPDKDKRIDKDIDANISYVKDLLGVGETYDINFREFSAGGFLFRQRHA